MTTDPEYPAVDPDLTEEIPAQLFPARTSRARTDRRPRIVVIVALLGNLLFGIGVIAAKYRRVIDPATHHTDL